MDNLSEQQDAAAIDAALPGSSAAVEELTLPDGQKAEVAVIEGAEVERPHAAVDMAYRLGRLETRLVKLEAENQSLRDKQSRFEEATVSALEAEAEALERQAAVVEATAEEVLPDDHPAAQANNPEHGNTAPRWWEGLLGGSQKRQKPI